MLFKIKGSYLQLLFLVISILSQYHVDGRDDLVYTTSFLDNNQMRTFYRTFRDFAMRIVGQTGRRTRGAFLQEVEDQFPCNVSGMRSENVPTSVHRLRPGKIRKTKIHLVFFFFYLIATDRFWIFN